MDLALSSLSSLASARHRARADSVRLRDDPLSAIAVHCAASPAPYRFVNRDDIDFTLAHDLPPVQTLEMVRDSGGVEVK